MNFRRLLLFTRALSLPPPSALRARDYAFDGTIMLDELQKLESTLEVIVVVYQNFRRRTMT
jgi:hypothetical protein